MGVVDVGDLDGDRSEYVHVEQGGGVGGGALVQAGVGQDGQQGLTDGQGVRPVEGSAEQQVHGAGMGEQFRPQVEGLRASAMLLLVMPRRKNLDGVQLLYIVQILGR